MSIMASIWIRRCTATATALFLGAGGAFIATAPASANDDIDAPAIEQVEVDYPSIEAIVADVLRVALTNATPETFAAAAPVQMASVSAAYTYIDAETGEVHRSPNGWRPGTVVNWTAVVTATYNAADVTLVPLKLNMTLLPGIPVGETFHLEMGESKTFTGQLVMGSTMVFWGVGLQWTGEWVGQQWVTASGALGQGLGRPGEAFRALGINPAILATPVAPTLSDPTDPDAQVVLTEATGVSYKVEREGNKYIVTATADKDYYFEGNTVTTVYELELPTIEEPGVPAPEVTDPEVGEPEPEVTEPEVVIPGGDVEEVEDVVEAAITDETPLAVAAAAATDGRLATTGGELPLATLALGVIALGVGIPLIAKRRRTEDA